MIIDSQVHCYEANSPQRPWHSVPDWRPSATGDEVVAEMDSLGVDGAIFISAHSLYQFDSSYALEVQRAHPGRFGLVKPIDPDDPAAEDRIMIRKRDAALAANDPGISRIIRAATRLGFPVNLSCAGNLKGAAAILERYPDTRFIIDHLGLLQPRKVEPEPWADLPQLLALAHHTNVVVKVSGVCMLSKQPYPYADMWDPLARVFDTWGIDRCLWGTDWTRTFMAVKYEQAFKSFYLSERLSESERAMLMGGACAKAYGWSPVRT